MGFNADEQRARGLRGDRHLYAISKLTIGRRPARVFALMVHYRMIARPLEKRRPPRPTTR